jgi:hypothetical protein
MLKRVLRMMMRKRRMNTNKEEGEEKLKKIAINENILIVNNFNH